ncbi:hypothetical protein ACZ90_28400 [Streptomyces albus subsp. albus]|nr:hypothetical protein ACZ90_28400 [Streptomyces albus subsp. albus]
MSADFYDPNKKSPGGPATPSTGDATSPAEPVSPIPLPAGAPSYPAQPPLPPVADGNLEPLRIPTAPQGTGAAQDRVRIGLWGAPRSGKTTYLAALPIAAMQCQRHGQGNWLISGMTPEANNFLGDSVSQLAVRRVFPQATVGIQNMSWAFQGEVVPTGVMRRPQQVSFVLEIQDASGEVFKRDHPQHQGIVDQLARAQGLIYLFDPLGDAQELTESLTFFYSTLNELSTRIRDMGGHYRGRLPHHVSVCVAKFDHPDVFRPSVEAGWVTQDSVGSQLPRVPAQLSERFFQWMCDDFRGSNARLVRDGLANYFHPSRITYYATSAIGFRLNPQHVFDYRNYANEEIVDGVRRISTSPEPINVLEPLTDLERSIRNARGGRKGWRR